MKGSSIRGILSKDDLIKLTENERLNLSVKDRMIKTVACISTDSDVRDAIQKIKQYRLECLPVCQNNILVGIITLQDLQGTTKRSS